MASSKLAPDKRLLLAVSFYRGYHLLGAYIERGNFTLLFVVAVSAVPVVNLPFNFSLAPSRILAINS